MHAQFWLREPRWVTLQAELEIISGWPNATHARNRKRSLHRTDSPIMERASDTHRSVGVTRCGSEGSVSIARARAAGHAVY
uniref:Uncharacterized protein n=1 Tax=Oryza rufipogon TaxID=4529 RepID=A0A0E0PB06_ORYRU